ncbi:glycoside hydrolase family 5 protein [Gelatoporia subvermispora B]|uniref:glucan 1,3-beta-glucosidase n=1 Tax=Ceriporiopsis subvermispora (strain B) TaxID=914234 RepID=M2RHR5_CERS8|nr:glycoside hydrolase family 5 protein [Gelatoporia subvermispora B]
MGGTPYLEEKRGAYASPRARSKRKAIIFGGIAALAAVIIVVVVAVYFTVVKPHSSSHNDSADGAAKAGSSATGSASSASPTGASTQNLAVSGGDGSTITTEDGTTFTYTNPFGGTWYYDPSDPFNNAAQAQSWTPALNETFNYGVDQIRGVNLGGWLVTEPVSRFVPALYEKYVNTSTPAVDEWTLSEAMANDTESGGLQQQLEDHYKTFITEQDFAEIAGAGLNWVRIPLPYWAIEVREGEPFLPQVAWKYFLKAIQWARKYGIRINLDFHSLPGSQNGWNHSGRLGSVNVLNGPMGIANAQRSLDYIRVIAEFISQPEYKDVVAMFGVTNEPQGNMVGQEALASYYLQAYDNVRGASGIGTGNGPFISFHDGFIGLAGWAGFFPNSDRTSLDLHPYICFDGQSSSPYSSRLSVPCQTWATNQNNSMSAFGLSTAGEFSNAINDCGLWVNGVNLGARYDGTYSGGGTFPFVGECEPWTDWTSWNQSMKADIQQFALASMDALQNWFFWTWKIGNSSVSGRVEAPAWSYQLGLQQGWMPTDPRQAVGICESTAPFNPPLQPWQTGGAGAGQIPASFSSSFAWPPATISNAGAATLLPTYTQTGSVPTLPAPTLSATASINAGDGWNNASDTASMFVPIATCNYLNPWCGEVPAPSPLCSAPAKRAHQLAAPTITAAP